MSGEPDLLEDSKFVDDAQLPSLNRSVARAIEIENELEALNATVEALNKEYGELKTKTLPEQLRAAGVRSLDADGGLRVELALLVTGSLPKEDKREPAIQKLRELDGASLIKNTITARVDLGKDELGVKAIAALKALGLEPEQAESVHPQTLMAWAREQLAVGSDRALAVMEAAPTLGLYIANIAKISRVKDKTVRKKR